MAECEAIQTQMKLDDIINLHTGFTNRYRKFLLGLYCSFRDAGYNYKQAITMVCSVTRCKAETIKAILDKDK